jgi:hypothetical protein
MKDTIDMAREAGFMAMRGHGLLPHVPEDLFIANVRVTEEINHLVALVRADERSVEQRPWVGLSDEERNKLWRDVVKWGDPSHDDVDLMKAIEAKLKEKNYEDQD